MAVVTGSPRPQVGLANKIRGRITRLRVFAAVKAVMEEEARVPTEREIADRLGVSRVTAHNHMAALDGADGLPFEIADQRWQHASEGQRRRRAAGRGAVYPPPSDEPVAVDELLAARETR